MSEKQISIIMSTKWRNESAREAILELERLAEVKESIEVIVVVDKDDADSREDMNFFGHLPLVYYVLGLSKMDGYLGICNYVTDGAKISHGDWIFPLPDDARIETPGWDRAISGNCDGSKVLKVLQPHPNSGKDIFPVMSRCLFSLLGHVSPHPQIDTWLRDLGKACGIMEYIPVNIRHLMPDDRLNNDNRKYRDDHLGDMNSPYYYSSRKWLERLGGDIDMVKKVQILDKNRELESILHD